MGHRVIRDQRVTTHVALTARAFGANKIVISGERDDGIITTIKRVCKEFGGDFEAEFTDDWRGYVEKWKKENMWRGEAVRKAESWERAGKKIKSGAIIHLTMYGADIDDAKVGRELARKASSGANLLIVVGGAKVPSEMYHLANYNVAVGNQPHSEVAAVAVVLDRILGKKARNRKFMGGKLEIIPNPRGKTVSQN